MTNEYRNNGEDVAANVAAELATTTGLGVEANSGVDDVPAHDSTCGCERCGQGNAFAIEMEHELYGVSESEIYAAVESEFESVSESELEGRSESELEGMSESELEGMSESQLLADHS